MIEPMNDFRDIREEISSDQTSDAINAVRLERVRQLSKHSRTADDHNTLTGWVAFTTRQLAHAVVYLGDLKRPWERGDDLRAGRKAFVRVAAIAVAAIESLDRRIARRDPGGMPLDLSLRSRDDEGIVRETQTALSPTDYQEAALIFAARRGAVVVVKNRKGEHPKLVSYAEAAELLHDVLVEFAST